MKILLCIDDEPFLPEVLGVLETSVALAPSSEVVALHVLNQPALFLVGGDPPRSEQAGGLMNRVKELLSPLPVTVTPLFARGDAAQEIVRVAETSAAELIVLGSRVERRDFLLGSVSRKVVSMAPNDVLVVRRRAGGGLESPRPGFNALLAVDGSLGSEAGIDAFTRKLRARCARIRLVHVVDSTPALWEVGREPRELPDAGDPRALSVLTWARECLERHGIEAEGEWRRGSPASQIVAAARETATDVIVLGSRGHTGIRDMVLGGITRRVLRQAPCSVFCARGWAQESGVVSPSWMSEDWEPGAGMA